jgi:hypothetical protein
VSRSLVRLLVLALPLLAGCSQHVLVDAAMASAYRPPAGPKKRAEYLLLAGDMHCHVLPPDPPGHVDRNLEETVALAKEEGLDFVLLTPHVRARFYADPERRAHFLTSQRELAVELAKQDLGDLLVMRGLEYTDFEHGHLTMGFADPEAVLAAVPLETARARPEAFFEAWLAQGGVVAINHPVLTPLPHFPLRAARGDLSWRPFETRGPFPPEIDFATHHAQGIEVFNLAVTHMRDGLILGDGDRSLRHAGYLLARRARLEGRRIAAIGGTDSHTHHLRAATWVLAEARTPAGIRDAIVAGRTCVRSPDACSFEAREASDDGAAAWQGVGASLHYAHIELRATAGPATVLADGVEVAHLGAGRTARVDVDPARCTVFYARVGGGVSSPIYAGCPF